MHAPGTPEREEAVRATKQGTATKQGAETAGTVVPPTTTAAALPALQRSVGNAAVVRAMTGNPGDPVQRSSLHRVLRSAGQPLDESTRADMESRLGADFSDVRVHTDAAARDSAAEIGARAYTSGEHVVVRDDDRHTLAHELTHVIQQRRGPVAGTDRGDGLAVSDPGDAYERAAEANARRVMAGGTPTVTPGAHSHGSEVVQRMPLADFDAQVADAELADDPDFVTFFEIEQGRKNPGPVVTDSAPGSRARLRSLVERPEVTPDEVTACIARYRAGGTGNRTQSAQLANPNLVGREVELPEVSLKIDKTRPVANGDPLAATAATTDVGLPVAKLEVEGISRMNAPGMPPTNASVELIYGPLPVADYASAPLRSARSKLRAALQKKGTLAALLVAYNGSLGSAEQRYALVATPTAATLTKGISSQSNPDTQTNVSTPYTKLGKEGAPGSEDFAGFFERANHETLYREARSRSGGLVDAAVGYWTGNYPGQARPTSGPDLKSLITQVLFQEAMYAEYRVERRQQREVDKMKFHALMKLSPQDAVMSIISDDEAKLLLGWLAPTDGSAFETAVKAVVAKLTTMARPVASKTLIRRYLVDALVTRLLAGRQLLDATGTGGRVSPVYGAGGREVAKLTHVHPRASNRIPITVSNGQYYMVVEQRAAHPLNDLGRNTTGMIGGLQTP